jgi:two-component system chemotaxis response regulator CheB
MGNDGAQGLRQLKKTGCPTMAQDEASSVVFGMPREAIAAGGVDEVLPLSEIAEHILLKLEEGRRA